MTGRLAIMVALAGAALVGGCATTDRLVDPDFAISYQITGSPIYDEGPFLLFIDLKERLTMVVSRNYLYPGVSWMDHVEPCDAGIYCIRLPEWDAPVVLLAQGSDQLRFRDWSYTVRRNAFDRFLCDEYEARTVTGTRHIAYRHCAVLGVDRYRIFDGDRLVESYDLQSYRGLGASVAP